MLNSVSRMLKREGYEVLSVERPRYALEIVATTSPVDLVVSDIVMPEMQGTQLVREVARLSPHTASVLMTGGVVNSAGLPIGVPVLKKPFTRQDLLSAVQEALERSAQARSDLRRQCEISAELRRQSTQLHAETAETIRHSRDILKRSRPGDEECQSE
jgi:DNA-binding NtrC family response regulator